MACNHLKLFKAEHGLQTYETIHGVFVCNADISSTYLQVLISCFDCETFSNRLLACMHCVYFGCFNKHIQEHAGFTSHLIYVELSNGHIYCYGCRDYIYDSDVENISEKHRLTAFKSGNNGSFSCPAFNGPTRYLPWKPTQADTKILQHVNRIKFGPSSKFGIRGLVNMGSTCFMNCIIQAFLHTPMLRDYFFADKHRCHARKTKYCLVCRFAILYQKYYADDNSPLGSLHEILHLVWINVPILAGKGQKDAHEFFISVLNLMQQHSSNPAHSDQVQSSSSIIDLIFHGKIQSDIVCQACANVSTMVDPFSDISLGIPDGPQPDADLLQCLDNFTRAEVLGLSAEIRCSSCQCYREFTKQLTFRLLPFVIVFHLKRFERANSKHKKKSFYVSFPTELDMSPYTSNLRDQTHVINSSKSNADNRYTLYAVVVHNGPLMETGHYLAYIRGAEDTWYKCNDLHVVPADTDEVMTSEGYLLFYHKTVLSYKLKGDLNLEVK